MTQFNTGNPVGSASPKDLYDNAENLDVAVNSPTERTWDDRLGQARKSWRGIEEDFREFLENSAYEVIGDYSDGPLLIERPSQIFSKDGEYYRAAASLALPYTTVENWAADESKFVAIGDAALRQELASPGGAFYVRDAVAKADTIAKLRALEGLVDGQVIELDGETLYVDGGDNSTPDNGITVYVTADGKRVKRRVINGVYYAHWAGFSANGTDDDTAAVQDICDFAPDDAVILYRGNVSLWDGEVVLTKDGQKHIAYEGLRLVRSGLNQTDRFFSGDGLSGVIIKGFRAEGTVDRLQPGFTASAACFRFDNCEDVAFYDVKASGGASGIQCYTTQGLKIYDSELTGNVLTGVSGVAGGVDLRRNKVYGNGYSASGQTHDVYFINSKRGRIIGCEVGPHNDPVSHQISVRYDIDSDDGTYDDVDDWTIKGNIVVGGAGARFNSLGTDAFDRKSVKNIRLTNNDFTEGAAIRFDEPENCLSMGNNATSLTVAVASQIPGYTVSFSSIDDSVDVVYQNALSAVRFDSRDNVKFIRTTINNGSAEAFRVITGYGGLAACSIYDPRLLGDGDPFDSGFLARYETNREVNVFSSSGLKHLNRDLLTLESGNNHTPDNHQSGSNPIYLAITDGAGTTINAPVISSEGMSLTLVLRNNGGSGRSVTFSSVYKLTSSTAAIKDSSVLNEYMVIRFKYISGAWRQDGEAGWSQP